MPTRRQFIKALGAGALSSRLIVNQTANAEEIMSKPNIVLILLDDLGYGDLSSYGATDLRTPNVDRLMSGGVRFNQFYANCPVCSPTRASVLTG